MKNINFKKLILVLGIIIVLNLFFNYGIKTFYNEPKYDDYCQSEYLMRKPIPSEPAFELQQQIDYEKQRECQEKYDKDNDFYKRNVFIVWIVAGVVSLVLGFSIAMSEAVSLGLSFGGLVSLIVGTLGYWSAMNDYLRFIILGIALAILVWIGIKKLKDSHENDGI